MLLVAVCATEALLAQQTQYHIGRSASAAEISAWDIAIGPSAKNSRLGVAQQSRERLSTEQNVRAVMAKRAEAATLMSLSAAGAHSPPKNR